MLPGGAGRACLLIRRARAGRVDVLDDSSDTSHTTTKKGAGKMAMRNKMEMMKVR